MSHKMYPILVDTYTLIIIQNQIIGNRIIPKAYLHFKLGQTMKLNSKTSGIIGNVSITRFNAEGNVVEKVYIPNLVVNIGKNYIASRLIGTTPATMTHIALGSNSTVAVVGDATLGTELGRVVLTSATTLDNVVTYTATFPAGVATGGIQEAGLFNASAAGTMLARTTFPIVNKGASDVLALSWSVTIL